MNKLFGWVWPNEVKGQGIVCKVFAGFDTLRYGIVYIGKTELTLLDIVVSLLTIFFWLVYFKNLKLSRLYDYDVDAYIARLEKELEPDNQ